MITIKHLAMIMDELQKARQKHPFFASSIRIETGEESWTTGIMRDQLRLEVQNGGASAETILQCEIAEAMEAYVMGDYDHCLQELAQCAAIVFRTMDMVAEKLKKGDNSEPNIN